MSRLDSAPSSAFQEAAEASSWVQPLVDAVRSGVQIQVIPIGSRCVVPTKDGIEVLDFTDKRSRFLDGFIPIQSEGTFRFGNEKSFVDYVRNHSVLQKTEIFANREKLLVEAVLDGHGRSEFPIGDEQGVEDNPGWGLHRALLSLRPGEEWKLWTDFAGRPHSQEEFCNFLEDNLPDVVEPAAASLLEAVSNLSLTTEASFSQATRLSTGEMRLQYSEEHKTGAILLPSQISLAIAPFEDAEVFKVGARLRYRLSKEKLTFTLLLDRPHLVVKEAFRKLTENIAAELDHPVYLGVSAAPLI